MITVRLPEDVYREVQRQGVYTLSPEQALRRGLLSYLYQPKRTKLLMDGTQEERLEDLLLMLAQTRASHGVLRTWEVSDKEEHASSREEYQILADELRRMEQGPLPRLEKEIKGLSMEVTQLEARLRARGADPDLIEPLFPVGVARPPVATSSTPLPGLLRRLWYSVAALRRKG